MYSLSQQCPGADIQVAAGGDNTASARPQGQDMPTGLGGMSRLGEQNVRYRLHQLPDGSGSHSAASNDPHCQAYLALQGTLVMA